MDTSQVVLRDRLERRQLDRDASQAIQELLNKRSRRRGRRCGGKEEIERGVLEASLLCGVVAVDEGSAEGGVDAGEEVGREDVKGYKCCSSLRDLR